MTHSPEKLAPLQLYQPMSFTVMGNVNQRDQRVSPSGIWQFILLHEKFLQFDWLRAVVFQLNLKYLHVKITKPLWVVVQTNNSMICT